jgi:NADPH2:quinone reductase
MKAVQVQKTGGPEALTVVDVPIPKPGPNEVLLKIAASGVNFIDVYYREGRYPAPLPFIDGQEASGTVSEVGSQVTSLKPGDRVAYTGVLGSYAEFAVVAAERLIPIPDSITDHQAAAAMLQGMTAHYLLKSAYPLKQGETALIHAAAGGLGLLLVQMAKRIGARIIGTAGSEEKAKLAREAGADEVIVYTQQDFETETKRLTGNKGVDVIYDGIGKTTFDKDLNILRPRGYLVLFGAASGPVPPVDPIKLTQKGSLFLTRPSLAHYTATREELLHRANEVLNMVANGSLKLRIDRVYKLEVAAQAHRDLEARKTTGKVLLVP